MAKALYFCIFVNTPTAQSRGLQSTAESRIVSPKGSLQHTKILLTTQEAWKPENLSAVILNDSEGSYSTAA
jgi:hypothetical protein